MGEMEGGDRDDEEEEEEEEEEKEGEEEEEEEKEGDKGKYEEAGIPIRNEFTLREILALLL